MKNLALAFFAVILCLAAPPARAKWPDILVAVNRNPSVCGQVYNDLVISRMYFEEGPDKDRDFYGMGPGVLRRKAPLILQPQTLVYLPEWGRDPVTWADFAALDRDFYGRLIDDGEQYGHTYAVFKATLSLYGELHPSDIYRLEPLSQMSNRRRAEIFLPGDGSSLSKAVNRLKASDLLQFGAFGFPVVREPGYVAVYGIDGYDPKKADDAQDFSTSLVCAFRSPAYDEAQNARNPAR